MKLFQAVSFITSKINFGYSFDIKRFYCSRKLNDVLTEKIRNIGILAHIDAGKTTVTERMLFYSGVIQNMGEVHHGNTVTDFMDQERERGITITSAAISFNWKKHQINLIDTPGHIDFTMEVEQTLNVLDSAVVVLDSSAGVEAQTLTVWRQSEQYNLPKIVFLNKMDRTDSNLTLCINSIEKKLETEHLLLQLPFKENGKLSGIIDILSMEVLKFGGIRDKQIERMVLTEKCFPELWGSIKEARTNVIDKLTNFDDDLANLVISTESLDDVKTCDVISAIKKSTLNKSVVPVLLGSAYKNIGIQSLLDAILLYLPSPVEKNNLHNIFEENLCARAFKVKHDKQKGPLVFFRIYNGTLNKGQKIYSIQENCSEQIGKLYVAHADDYKEVDSVTNGNIAVASGLKKIVSGNSITNSQTTSQKAQKKLDKILSQRGADETSLKLFSSHSNIPEPVFFCSIEPPSLSAQTGLEQALMELQREDPSLRVSHNAETGQTVLAGMGELHLEIIKDRILREYKIEADLGPLQIAYRESPTEKVSDQLLTEMQIGKSRQFVLVNLTLVPVNSLDLKDVLKLDKSPAAASNIASIFPKHLIAVRQGIEIGLANGPKINSPVINASITLHMLEVGRGTADSIISATVTQLVQKLLKKCKSCILEPVMNLEIVTPEEYFSMVLADLTRRRSIINDITVRGNTKVISTNTPLAEIMGYSTVLRTLTSGTGTFAMEFNAYQKMTVEEEEKAIQTVRGF